MRQLTIKETKITVESRSNRGCDQRSSRAEDRYFQRRSIFQCRSIIIPAEFLDHVLRVAGDFARKLNGVDPAHDERICLHWITTGEWRTATQQHSVLGQP